jgi:hypothetical protein
MITIGGYTGVNILERGLGLFSLFYVNVREYRKSKMDKFKPFCFLAPTDFFENLLAYLLNNA